MRNILLKLLLCIKFTGMNFTRIFSYFFTRMYPYVSRLYPYVSRMYPYVTRMLVVCYSYVSVCSVCYSYVTRMLPVCTRVVF